MSKITALLALGLCSAAIPSSLVAQKADRQGASCQGSVAPLEKGGKSFLQIVCAEKVVILGQADSYELIELPSLDAAVTISTFQGSQRAWLIIKEIDGLALEEITGTIARLGGRGAQRDLDGLTVEFGELNLGQVNASVRSQGRNAVALDFTGMVARSRSARASAALREGK